MPNAITSVGTLASTSTFGATTLTVNPTAVGDCLIFVTNIGSTTVHAASVSGGGCTWTHVVGPLPSATQSMDMWLGKVTTTGSSSITVTGSAAITGFTNQFMAQQFHGGTSPTWGVDGTQATTKTNTASTTITWPTLVPSGANDLYVGFGASSLGATASTQTAGYTMTLVGGLPFLYNVSVSTSQTPTCTNASSSTSFTIGALIQAVPLPSGNHAIRIIGQAMQRASLF